LLPKRYIAVLNGQPDYCDDVLALERVLQDTDLRKVVILCWSRQGARARHRYPELSPDTVTVAKRTLRGVLYAMTAKYVFFTHSWAAHRCPGSVESMNVWHGMPVKRVGWMVESGPDLPIVKYSLATSPFWQTVVQESLRPTVETFVTGLPRNDRLVLGDRGVLKRLGYSLESGTRMIAWLPTYRYGWSKGGMRMHCSHVLDLTADELHDLNDMLQKHDALVVVKRHPLAEPEATPELSRIVYLNDEWLLSNGFTLHELLGESCALVTDVSSAYVDYLVLDRPIVHHFPDIEAYRQERGYSIEPIQDYLAGPVVEDPAGLTAALLAILQGKDTHAEQRHRIRGLFQDPLGGSAAERVVSALGLAAKPML
jgi:CDP-glycerol glycerophosphotransferase (TagB/SpsB family)